MINPLFFRFHHLNIPLEMVTEEQQKALDKFRKKLTHNTYLFEETLCLCGGCDGKLVARRDRYAIPVDTYICRSCGVMWTNPRMSEESLNKFYEDDYRPIYIGTANVTDDFFLYQVRHGNEIYDFVAPSVVINPERNMKVFDIGCGAGGTLVPFSEFGWSAFGCDLNDKYLQYGKEKGLTLERGDAHTLTKHGHANLIILSHVLEHFPHPLSSLEQITQLLLDGGYIYIELPGIFNIHKSYGDFMLFLQNAHLYHFTLTTLTSLMAKAGFRLVKGDESIRALFQRDESVKYVPPQNQYYMVLAYLYFIEIGHILRLPSLLRMARMARNLALRKTMRVIRWIKSVMNTQDIKSGREI